MSENKKYSREEYVYLAKLYERAERFPDMVKYVNKYVELDPKLTKEERNILSAGYKNIISSKRASWRLLNTMERKEEKKKFASNFIYQRNKRKHRKRIKWDMFWNSKYNR